MPETEPPIAATKDRSHASNATPQDAEKAPKHGFMDIFDPELSLGKRANILKEQAIGAAIGIGALIVAPFRLAGEAGSRTIELARFAYKKATQTVGSIIDKATGVIERLTHRTLDSTETVTKSAFNIADTAAKTADQVSGRVMESGVYAVDQAAAALDTTLAAASNIAQKGTTAVGKTVGGALEATGDIAGATADAVGRTGAATAIGVGDIAEAGVTFATGAVATPLKAAARAVQPAKDPKTAAAAAAAVTAAVTTAASTALTASSKDTAEKGQGHAAEGAKDTTHDTKLEELAEKAMEETKEDRTKAAQQAERVVTEADKARSSGATPKDPKELTHGA